MEWRHFTVIAVASANAARLPHLADYGIGRKDRSVEGYVKNKSLASLTLVIGLLSVCGSMYAHHGSAAYDDSKAVVLKNVTVTKVNWGNPHTLLLFDVKDDQGNVKHWVAEANAASAISSSGWTRTAIQPGDTVTVVLYAARNGQPVGRVGKVILANGKEFGDGSLIGDRPAVCDQDFGNGGNESAACRPDGRKTSNKE
jgi:hypothetical protein